MQKQTISHRFRNPIHSYCVSVNPSATASHRHSNATAVWSSTRFPTPESTCNSQPAYRMQLAQNHLIPVTDYTTSV